MLCISFWSPVTDDRWVPDSNLPPSSARKALVEHAEARVRELRARGIAAYAHPLNHSPSAHYQVPPSWTFDAHGRVKHRD